MNTSTKIKKEGLSSFGNRIGRFINHFSESLFEDVDTKSDSHKILEARFAQPKKKTLK